jgi:hypothetical protein
LLLLFLSLLLHVFLVVVSNEIVRRVLNCFVNTPTKDCLGLNSLHLISCLQTHVKDLLLRDVINLLDSTFQVHRVLRSFFVGKVETFLAEFFTGSGYSHPKFGPALFDDALFDLF